MSKRELKGYLQGLTKKQMEAQVLDLYTRFKDVKEYYDFAFNPKENELIETCRFQISKEYFPVNRRKAKARRSVAQKWIRKLKTLGAEPSLIASIMLYNIEVAQSYASEKYISQDSFYKSIHKSFEEAVSYISVHVMQEEFSSRIDKIAINSVENNWPNKVLFEKIADNLF